MNNNVTKYNNKPLGTPWYDLKSEFIQPFSNWFEDIFNENSEFGVDFFRQGTYPKVDVVDDEKNLSIVADLPGLNKEQVKVEINDGVLSIRGEKREEKEEKKKNLVHCERKMSSFCRSFSIGDNVDKDNIDAKFENGVLTVTLPKVTPTPKPSPKQITIK